MLSVLTNTFNTTLGFYLKTRTYLRVVNSASVHTNYGFLFSSYHHCDTCAVAEVWVVFTIHSLYYGRGEPLCHRLSYTVRIFIILSNF